MLKLDNLIKRDQKGIATNRKSLLGSDQSVYKQLGIQLIIRDKQKDMHGQIPEHSSVALSFMSPIK